VSGGPRRDPSRPPPSAAWRHRDAREGFECVFPGAAPGGGWRLDGWTTGVEEGVTWVVGYRITVDARWHTTAASVWSRSGAGEARVEIAADGEGGWTLDGVPAPQVAGVLDVDLEASACTNTFPVHRLALAPGAAAEAPAAYVRAPGLAVERLEQTYRRVEDRPTGPAFDYESPAFGTSCRLAFDEALLVVDYPDLAVRVA
jgi:hypothetical protein